MNNNLNDVTNSKEKSCDNSCLLSLPPKQFATAATLFGLLLIDDLSIDQQSALGNFFLSVGQTILTASAQEQSLKSCNSQNDQIQADVEDLKNQIALLKQALGNRI